MFGRYRQLFTPRGAVTLTVWSMIGRLQLGMLPLATVLYVRQQTGSFAAAGVASGVGMVAVAVTSTIKGRLIDRHGLRAVLLPLALLNAAAFAFLLAAPAMLGAAASIAAAALVGVTRSNLTTYMRAVWRQLHTDDRMRLTAGAFEATLAPVSVLVGPLLVAALVAVASPAAALIVCAAASVAGTAGFALAADRHVRSERSRARGRSLLHNRSIALLLAVGAAAQAPIGLLQVALPAFAERAGGSAGVLMACLIAGSVPAGLVYGARSWPMTPDRQLRLGLAVQAAGLAPLALAGSYPAMAAMLCLGSISQNAVIACIQHLVCEAAPEQRVTEAMSWWVVTGSLGISVGNAVAGALVDASGPAAALALAAAIGVIAWLLAQSVRPGS